MLQFVRKGWRELLRVADWCQTQQLTESIVVALLIEDMFHTKIAI